MKKLLLLSIVMNAVLVLMTAGRFHSLTEERMHRQPRMELPQSHSTLMQKHLARTNAVTEPQTAWDKVCKGDVFQMVASLRKIGCPEMTIQDIVLMKLGREMHQKLVGLAAENARMVPYWKTVDYIANKEEMAARQSLLDGMNETLEHLFGSQGNKIRMRLMGWPDGESTDSYLPDEKKKKLSEIDRRYSQLLREAQIERASLPAGFQDPEMTARDRETQKAKEKEIQALMTPSEYEEYKARNSPAAQYVRDRLPEASSEAEFRRMVKVADSLGMDVDSMPASARFGNGMVDGDPEDAKAWKQKEKKFQDALAQELGEDRIAEQKQKEADKKQEEERSRSQQQVVNVVTDIGGTAEEGKVLFERLESLRPEMEKKFDERMKNATPEQRKVIEGELKVILEQAASEVMGPEKAKALIKKMMSN